MWRVVGYTNTPLTSPKIPLDISKNTPWIPLISSENTLWHLQKYHLKYYKHTTSHLHLKTPWRPPKKNPSHLQIYLTCPKSPPRLGHYPERVRWCIKPLVEWIVLPWWWCIYPYWKGYFFPTGRDMFTRRVKGYFYYNGRITVFILQWNDSPSMWQTFWNLGPADVDQVQYCSIPYLGFA